MSQSTNDTFPTAILVGCVLSVEDNLLPVLESFRKIITKEEQGIRQNYKSR